MLPQPLEELILLEKVPTPPLVNERKHAFPGARRQFRASEMFCSSFP